MFERSAYTLLYVEVRILGCSLESLANDPFYKGYDLYRRVQEHIPDVPTINDWDTLNDTLGFTVKSKAERNRLREQESVESLHFFQKLLAKVQDIPGVESHLERMGFYQVVLVVDFGNRKLTVSQTRDGTVKVSEERRGRHVDVAEGLDPNMIHEYLVREMNVTS